MLVMWVCICSNLVVKGISIGAVEFMISPHDVCEVCISFAFQFLRRVAFLVQKPGVSCKNILKKIQFSEFIREQQGDFLQTNSINNHLICHVT